MICSICNQNFDTVKDRNLHVARRHKMKLEIYCSQYEKRFDLFTKEPIEFKNYDFYSHAFFNNRKNLVSYYKSLPKEGINQITTQILKERKEIKQLKWAPSTVCARLAVLPSPLLVHTYGGDYNIAAKAANLETRFNYDVELELFDGPLELIQDTKEQRPLQFNCKLIKSSLDFGDYTCKTNYKKLFIERKSLNDLAGTLSAGFERFNRELERAKEMDASIIVLIEEDISSFLSIGYSPHTKHIKASADFLGHRIRDIFNNFKKVQFLFVDGRKEAARVAEKLFKITNDINIIDCQYLYDSSKL